MMEATARWVSVSKLKEIRLSVIQQQLQVCVRYLSQFWHPSFFMVVKSVRFHDGIRKKQIGISDPMVEMNVSEKSIGCDRLRCLLYDLAAVRNGPSIRIQLTDEPGPDRFSQVLVGAKHAIVLAHIPSRTVVNITDLSRVAEFELDRPYHEFSAFTPYSVDVPLYALKTHSHGVRHT